MFGKILRPLIEIKSILSGQSLVPSSKLGQVFIKIIPKLLKVKEAIMGIVSVISSIGAGPILAIVAAIAEVCSHIALWKKSISGVIFRIKITLMMTLLRNIHGSMAIPLSITNQSWQR